MLLHYKIVLVTGLGLGKETLSASRKGFFVILPNIPYDVMRVVLLIAVLCLSACSSGTDSSKPAELTGKIKDNKFVNEYLTIDIGDWTVETDSLDDMAFLKLQKNSATITFGSHKKNFYEKTGITSEHDIKRALVKSYQFDPEYKVVYDKTLKIDGIEFLTVRTLYGTSTKSAHTIFYFGEMHDYYLIVIFVWDERWPAVDGEKLIAAVKFT